LGDAAAVIPKRIVHRIHRGIDFLRRAEGNQVLPVDFAPKREFALKGRQFLHAYTKNLRVEGVKPQLN
jgi:hypothetical protein